MFRIARNSFFRWGQLLLCTVLVSPACSENKNQDWQLQIVGKSLHDFGEAHQNKVLHHAFVIRNTSNIPVRIVKANSSCGCLVLGEDGTVPDNVVLPGKDLTVPVNFSTRTRQGKSEGRVVIFYGPEDPEHVAYKSKPKSISLRIQTDVLSPFIISPRSLDFGNITEEKAVKQILTITPREGNSVKITEAGTSHDSLKTKILPPQSDQETSTRIEVTFDPLSFTEDTAFNGRLLIHTDNQQLSSAIINVKAKLIAPVTVQPDVIVISSDKSGDVKNLVKINTNSPSRIVRTSSPSDQIQVEFDPSLKSRQHDLNVLVKHNPSTSLDSQLEIQLVQLDTQKMRSMSIPVYRFVNKDFTNIRKSEVKNEAKTRD